MSDRRSRTSSGSKPTRPPCKSSMSKKPSFLESFINRSQVYTLGSEMARFWEAQTEDPRTFDHDHRLQQARTAVDTSTETLEKVLKPMMGKKKKQIWTSGSGECTALILSAAVLKDAYRLLAGFTPLNAETVEDLKNMTAASSVFCLGGKIGIEAFDTRLRYVDRDITWYNNECVPRIRERKSGKTPTAEEESLFVDQEEEAQKLYY